MFIFSSETFALLAHPTKFIMRPFQSLKKNKAVHERWQKKRILKSIEFKEYLSPASLYINWKLVDKNQVAVWEHAHLPAFYSKSHQFQYPSSYLQKSKKTKTEQHKDRRMLKRRKPSISKLKHFTERRQTQSSRCGKSM